MVSIVLPCHNGSRTLADSVESCLQQTYGAIELIVVDDASNDSTPSILEQFRGRDPRVQCLRHEVNRGLPASLNAGFAQATGTYLTWTSDDNMYRPNAIAEMVWFLEHHRECAFVYADYTIIDEIDHTETAIAVREPQCLPTENIIGPCFLYRRAVADALGPYDEGLFLAEDYDFWLRAYVRYPLSPLHKDLYLYRCHGGTLSSQRTRDVERATERCLAHNIPALRALGRLPAARAHWRIAQLAGERGATGMARRHAAAALVLSDAATRKANWRIARHALAGSSVNSLCRRIMRRDKPGSPL
jgi:glycosyltransferase involved in cell wall biosynthesis